jgi:hypothetical protein
MLEAQDLRNTRESAPRPAARRAAAQDGPYLHAWRSCNEPGIARTRDIAETYAKMRAKLDLMPDRAASSQIRQTLSPEFERLLPPQKAPHDA